MINALSAKVCVSFDFGRMKFKAGLFFFREPQVHCFAAFLSEATTA